MPSASLPNEDYSVGWICALPQEAAAATAMLDEIHEEPQKRLLNDSNVYTLGRIGEHNVVIACLPAGVYGTHPAAAVATQMLSSFESIRVGLMVGIGGGVPSVERDLRLGDVVVSKPGGTFGGVVQYDRGKTTEGKFERTGLLNKPPQVLLSAVSAMEKKHMMGESKISEYLADMLRKYPRMREKFSYQSTQHDATHGCHSGNDNVSESRPAEKPKYRSPEDPVVHYGLIASGNQVIKDATTRDQLRQELGGDVLCFEMEAAGLMDTFPCVVIRGICDYADYRKNDLWQGYAAATAAACAKELLGIIQGNRVAVTLTAADRLSPRQAVCFVVPFERDLNFIGREDVISEIDRRFEVQRRVALAGIGGVGKSQIAIEYCYRFRDRHAESHVFWIHASTVYRVDQAYKDIARKLCLPGWNDPNVDTFQLVLEWFSDDAHGPWLLVLDNADDMETFFSIQSNPSSVGSEDTAPLVNYLPRSSNASMLITTRDKRVGGRLANREKAIMVLPMAEPEAERLLWSKVDQEDSMDKAKSSELLEVLGYLPLAITQAAAYISENSITVEEYLNAIHTEDSEIQDLLSEELPDLRRNQGSQKNSVIRTWKVSFDQIRKQKPRAADMLSLMAVLDRQGIPKMLLRRDGERGTEFTTALGTLQAFSLAVAEKGGASFEIHRLVQVSTQRWLELQGETTKWQEEALKVLTAAFPSGDYGTWVTCEALTPHTLAISRYKFTSDLNLLQRAELLYRMSSYDEAQGRYDLAYERGLDALSTREKLLGTEHPETLMSMNNIALVLLDRGKYEEAEDMHRRTLELRKKVLDPEHPNALTSMNNLAMALEHQDKYEAAEEMYQQVLELREKVLGPEHPDTLMSISNVAGVLRGQGKYEAAEEMHRRALELKKKVLDPEHPDVLMSMNHLAWVLRVQGKYRAAEEMHRRTLELRKKVLGPKHPDTLTSMNNLAVALDSQGKYGAAEEMYRRALELSEIVLGSEHPETLWNMRNLADSLQSQGKYKAVEEMHRQALELCEKALGSEHPETLMGIHKLAVMLHSQGKYRAAEEMHRRALGLFEKVLGLEHPSAMVSMNSLALTLQSQGKYEAATKMHQQVLELKEKVLRPEHPDTLMTMNNLAQVFRSQGNYEAAKEMHQQVLELRDKVLGPEHPDTLTSMSNLAWVLDSQGKYEAAEEMYRRTLELSEEVLGPENPDTLTSMNDIALVLDSQGKYKAAEEMHWQTLKLREKVLGSEHPDTLRSMNNLAAVLRSQGKHGAAEEMQRQTLELRKKVLGPEHPDTLVSMDNLAVVFHSQGNHGAAEEMHRRTLELRKRVLGPEHPNTLLSIDSLAVVLCSQGKHGAAEEMHRRTLELKKKVLGTEHPDTLISMNNLAATLRSQGKHGAAEEMHRRTLELRKKVLGPEHPDTLISMDNLAVVLSDQGKHEAAEEMHRGTLELRKKVLGPEHPDTLISMDNLAVVLHSQGKHEATEEMHQRTLELRKKVLSPEHPDTLMSMNSLAMVYRLQGNYEAAKEMHQRTLELRKKVLGPEHPDTLISMGNLAVLLSDQGKHEAAEEIHRRAVEPMYQDALASMDNLE